MSWFSWFKTANKTQDDLLNKNDGLLTQVGSWIGNMHYTEEERAEMTKTMNEGVAKFVSDSLNESTARSTTRRSVAIMWIQAQLLLIFATALTGIIEYGLIMYTTGEPVHTNQLVLAQFIWNIAISEVMFWSTLSVIAFFFSSYIISHRFNIPLKK